MLKKDLIELCLLQMLCMGDKYGYEMLSPLRAAFPDTQESAIYAILRGLCKNGFTQWYMAEGGGERTFGRAAIGMAAPVEGNGGV